jgi:hypothetical protein
MERDPARDLETLQSVVTGTAREWGTVRATHGLRSREGSPAARELEQQSEFADGWGDEPVLMAYGVAWVRLVAAAEQLRGIGTLLGSEDTRVFGPASLARTVLETSSRAWWLLEANLSVETRVLRGMTEWLAGWSEVHRMNIPEIQERAARRISEIEASAGALGFEVRRSNRGALLGIGPVDRVGYRALIREQHGAMGDLAYSDLSGVAHSEPQALITRTQRVGEDPQHVFIGPIESPETTVPMIGIAVLGFVEAAGRDIYLQGWDRTTWSAWWTEAGRALLPLIRRR